MKHKTRTSIILFWSIINAEVISVDDSVFGADSATRDLNTPLLKKFFNK